MVFTVQGVEVSDGSHAFVRLRVADMLDGNELTIPLHIIHGSEKGPVLGLFACIHGTEYYSNRIIKRALEEVNVKDLKGTVLAVPVANPIAFAHGTRQTPEPPEETVDFSNLNRVFPGRRITPLFGSKEETDVSLTMRMAAVITNEVVTKCTHIIDFHGQRIGMALNKMLFNRASEETMVLAKVFGLGIIHDPEGEGVGGVLGPMTDHAERLGIPGIAPEIGGAGHSEAFEKECEKIGARGVANTLKYLKMSSGELVLPKRQFWFRKAPHVRATRSGYLVSNMEPEDVGIGRSPREVKKGEILATIYNPYSLIEVEQIKSPVDGILYACRTSGILGAQAEVLAVADFEGSKWLE